jgi:hypothetical protein
MAPENRSAHPDIRGVPWWGAILIATSATLAGFAIDAGSGYQELTGVFSACYVIGCVTAVLAVRQAGIFTAVVQPPLILFIAVPTSYFLFHRAEINGLREMLINCGYPLIERFLLMFTTSVVVLLIGMARWYVGAPARSGEENSESTGTATASGLVGGVGAKIAAILNRGSADDSEDDTGGAERARRPRRHTVDRPAATPRERQTTRNAPTRSRNAPPPMDDLDVPRAAPRRRYPGRAHDGDDVPGRAPRRRRTPRDPGKSTPRGHSARDRELPDAPDRPRRRYGGAYQAYEPHEPYELYGGDDPSGPSDEPPPPSTHHPFSNVRYRGSTRDDDDDDRRYRRPRG